MSTEKKIKSNPLPFKTIIVIAMVVVIVALFATKFFFKKSVEVVVSSILTDEKVVSELSTLEVPYAGIYQELDDKNGKVKRSIAYSGLVSYGVDFSQITSVDDKENKIITLIIPNVKLSNVYVEPNTLRSIPEGKIAELQNRLQNCKKDLENKFINDEETKKLAVDSTIDTLKNFFEPIIEAIDKDYKLEIKLAE